jgi:hypothetical protein
MDVGKGWQRIGYTIKGELIDMKAIVHKGYGSSDILSVAEVYKLTMKENEVLIKVYLQVSMQAMYSQ